MIEVDERAVDAMLAEDPGGPVVMLNLLRFRPDGGRESYQRYIDAMGVSLVARYGLRVEYVGVGGTALAAEPGQAWDMVVLVRYPDRASFVNMVRDPEYRALEHLRRDALTEAVLQPTGPVNA